MGQRMGLRVDALKVSKQMVQEGQAIFVRVRIRVRIMVGGAKVFEKNESIFL
jgi:hypothetical protein